VQGVLVSCPEYIGDFSEKRTRIIYGGVPMSIYMNEYQLAAYETAIYDDPMYPIASLMVEAGELADLFIKPWLRGDYTEIDRDEVISEAGDVLWNLAALLKDQDITLDEVAQYNMSKLKRRAENGTIQGSGNR
jgi:NTP pyrophosphatase (non-canonical NTP hydrolase)